MTSHASLPFLTGPPGILNVGQVPCPLKEGEASCDQWSLASPEGYFYILVIPLWEWSSGLPTLEHGHNGNWLIMWYLAKGYHLPGVENRNLWLALVLAILSPWLSGWQFLFASSYLTFTVTVRKEGLPSGKYLAWRSHHHKFQIEIKE